MPAVSLSLSPRSAYSKGNSKKGFWRRDDVDIASIKGRHYVTNTEETEWLEYSIFSKNLNQCQISINYFGNKTGEIYFEINGELATQVINLPKSNSLKPINYKLKEKISIPKGNSILRLYIKEGGINLDSIIFSS